MSELNFVEVSTAPSSPSSDVVSPRRWPWILGIGGILFFLIFGPFVYGAILTSRHLRFAKHALNTAYAQLSQQAFLEARDSFRVARHELEATREERYLFDLWKQVPWVRVHIQAFDQALNASFVGLQGAEQAMGAAANIQEALDRVLRTQNLAPQVHPERSFKDFSREEKRAVLARVAVALPEIRAAHEKALIALDVWDRIPQTELISPVRRELASVTLALKMFRDRSQIMMDLASLFLPVIGYPEPKTYVILLQNADELRPTGGFIGTVGVMRLDSGELIDQSFQDVYAFDRMASSTMFGPAPEPLRRELGVDAWYLRDSNWSPDASQTAARISSLFEQQNWLSSHASSVRAETVDGVWFLQPAFFSALLRFTGPIIVDGITFTEESFFDQLQYAVEVGFAKQGIPLEERKQIISKLGSALIDRLAHQPAQRWMMLFDLGIEAFAHKNIMVVMRDPSLARLFDAREWSGRARTAIQDELWVVDTNLAALKTDGVMEKRVDYRVDATNPQNVLATVRLHYTNTNRSTTWRYTRYRDYVRVFVPEGSELVSAEGGTLKGRVDVMKDLGKTVFGAFWSIEPGETQILAFTYRLPARVIRPLFDQGIYQLLVQKQAGAKHRLTLDLRFGKKLRGATPSEAPSEFGDDRYRGSLDLQKDALFHLQF